MKILIFSIYNNPEQLISSFKIYEQNKNEEVYFLNCSNSLKFCDINPDNYFSKCFECIADKFFLINLFNISDEQLINIDNNKRENIDIPLFNSIDELKSFNYNNINYGLYAYNSIVNITKKENFNIRFVRQLIKNIINESINFYNKILNILDEIKPDKFYIYKNDSIIYIPITELSINKNIETINFYVNDTIINFYNPINNQKLDYNIFIEKVNNEYFINGQRIGKFIYTRTKNEILRAINKYDEDSFSKNVETFKFFKDLEKQTFWKEEESNIIKSKVLEIYDKLDKKSNEAKENVKISACMIVKNEEKNLERCLNSIKDIVDEIIILDTGSTDNTVNIAEKYNAKIFNYNWINDFSDARNKSISYAKNDWILVIDADEELTENTRKNLLITIYDEPLFKEELIFWFKCLNIFPNEQESTFYFKHFLFNKKYGFIFEGKVHEYLINPNNTDKVLKKHCHQFTVNHYCSLDKNKEKSKYYLQMLEEQLKNEKTLKGKISVLSHLANEYQKIGDSNKSFEILLETYNLFQQDEELKSTLTYISNLIGISATLIFNYFNFQEARKYVDEIFKLIYDYNFPDAIYLKALIEHNTNNYQEAINLYLKLINSFRSNEFDKETSYGLNSKGKTLYPLTVIQLYKLYMTLNKEDLALNVLLGNEHNYYLVNMFVIKHFLFKKDFKNSVNAYFRNVLISKENKDHLYKLITQNRYKEVIYQIINELLNTKEVFDDYDKKELELLLKSVI